MQNVLAVIFKTESEGFQAITEVRNAPTDEKSTVFQGALIKRTEKGFEVCDQFDTGLLTGDDMMIGGVVGGILGILGGPLGVLLLGSAGALVGSAFDAGDIEVSEAMFEVVADKMAEGELALIVLANEEDETVLDGILGKFQCEIIRFDAAVVAAEAEEAAKVQEELERQARQELRKAKKEEHKAKVEEKRAKMNADWAVVKQTLNTDVKDLMK